MTVHRLETKIEQAELKRARHLVDINRRDASISALEHELGQVRSVLEKNMKMPVVSSNTLLVIDCQSLIPVSARHVTCSFSAIPKSHPLPQSTESHLTALSEATAINAQQAAEIERLTTALTVRGSRNQNSLQDPSFDGEVALRSEIEALRAKSREQTALIARLQLAANSKADSAPTPGRAAAPPLELVNNAAHDEARAKLERDLREARTKLDEQSIELKTLRAERDILKAADSSAAGDDSKVALRARLAGVQSQADQQAEQLRHLRTELATANERLAQQSAHNMEQMRRLGAGTIPASAQGRRSDVVQPPRLSLAERVAQTRTQTPPSLAPAVNEDDASAAKTDVLKDHLGVEQQSSDDTSKARLIDRISSLTKA